MKTEGSSLIITFFVLPEEGLMGVFLEKDDMMAGYRFIQILSLKCVLIFTDNQSEQLFLSYQLDEEKDLTILKGKI